MGILEQVMQLKQQGQNDSQIIESLQQQGTSPKDINEALSQSKVKSAINEQEVMMQQSPQTPQQAPAPSPETQQMQPSMMQAPSPEQQPPTQQEQQFTQPMQEMASLPTSTIQQPQPSYPEYSQYPEYQPQAASDIETINEIAEQITEEKTTQLKKQITGFTKFREEISLEVEKANERLLKIEATLNELQMAVLGKIGQYGKDIQNIAKEMHATQDSFSKILNPLTDNIRELQKITGSEEKPGRPKPKTKSRAGRKAKEKVNFEDYLR